MTKEELIQLFKSATLGPFLFIGSGFTKRYFNTPTWEEVLAEHTKRHPNQYYSTLNTQDLSKVASEIAKETNNDFWQLPDEDTFKQEFKDKAIQTSSVLKEKISRSLKRRLIKDIDNKYKDEINILKKCSIDGIITTNWDDFCEQLFPKFQRVIGQSALISSTSLQYIGEIYKIHGCMHSPETMILTHEDYEDYNNKNAYLAAKLITIFVEHPIVFIGYSITDKNIRSLFEKILFSLSDYEIQKLQERLIFVEWVNNPNIILEIEKTTLQIGTKDLPLVKVKTYEFTPIYELLSEFKRGIPSHLLRKYKEHFYKIVHSEAPEKQLLVVSDDEIDSNESIEYVCGFGAITKYNNSVGYTGLKAKDIFWDLISDQNYEAEKLLKHTLPSLSKGNAQIPLYKYLRKVGVTSDENCKEYRSLLKKGSPHKASDFLKYPSMDSQKDTSVKEAMQTHKDFPWKICALIPYLSISNDDLELIQKFAEEQFETFFTTDQKANKYTTYYRNMLCFYDWKKYGW